MRSDLRNPGQSPLDDRAVLLATCLTMISCVVILSGCTTNAATGRSQLNFMSTPQEIAIGEQAMPALIEEYGGVVSDSVLRRYVTELGTRLKGQTEAENPDLPWEFTLLDSAVINAFALPGGKVFMSRGLMMEMENEAQLAGVLGHEIGHVTAQHVDERISRAMGASLVATILGAALRGSDYERITSVIVGFGGQGFLLKFSRDQESEADRLGMRYMARAGYDPAGQLQVMMILDQAQRENPGGPPEFLSTHPLPETRIRRIQDWLRSDFAGTQNNPEYQLYEERFQRIARPRLDSLAQMARDRHQAAIALGVMPPEASDGLGHPQTWCAVCRPTARSEPDRRELIRVLSLGNKPALGVGFTGEVVSP